MNSFNGRLIDIIKDRGLEQYLLKCNFGLEKENVRVDKYGKLVFTPHPKVFGDRMKNPYIKTDFSESQIELSTPVCGTIEETYKSLENLHDIVCLQLENEYLWPQSSPPYLPEDKEIPIARMGNKEEEEFRAVLAKKYGRKKQLISGIHYNFSFKKEFLKVLYDELSSGESYTEFKNSIYLKICRNFLKYRWLLIYLTGASPVFHNTFIKEYVDNGSSIDGESYYFPDMMSLRNSDYGYKNRENFYVSFNSVKEYIDDINELVRKNELQDICEFYGPIRLKTGNNDNLSNELLEDGIKYIELRIFDINPLFKIGINMDILYFVHLFLLYMLFIEDESFGKKDHIIANKNANMVSFYGMKNGLEIYGQDGKEVPFGIKALEILDSMERMIGFFWEDCECFINLIETMKSMIINPKTTYAGIIFNKIKEKSFIKFHIKKAEEYFNESKKNVALMGTKMERVMEYINTL